MITPTANRLYVLWTSADREVATKMVFMYTFNAKAHNWWSDVTLIIWGPSAKLLANDPELQEKVRQMQQVGVETLACKACTDSYGVSATLVALGIEVLYMGEPLTDILHEGARVITI
jgi:hypothetical protein